MAGATVLINCKLLIGGLDLSGDSNQMTLQYGAEMLDDTVFQPVAVGGTRSAKPGLKTVEVNASIFWNTNGDSDAEQFRQVGLATHQVMSIAQIGESEGDYSAFTKGVRGTYNPLSGEVGQLIQAQVTAQASNAPLIRGRLMKRGTVTVTGSGTGINLGSLADKIIYSGLHILSPLTPGGGGEQIIGTIESDDNAGFTTPTTRLTHTTMTEDGSDWQQATLGAGVTDTHWRATWTIAGAAPSFLIHWSFGYQTL